MARVRVRVLKRVDPETIFGEEVPVNPSTGEEYKVCPRFQEGQEFMVEEDGEMPEGFCAWAWHDIYKDLSVLRFGGNFPWAKEGEMITCCTDGIRPVSFRMERLAG